MMKYILSLTAEKKSDQKLFTQFEKSGHAILSRLGFQSASLSILLVRDRKMAALNQKLMKHSGTTDVLSFSYIEKKGKVRLTKQILAAKPPVFLGEVIICLDTAKRNAAEYGVSFKQECALYLCHGILHCLGYDDQTQKGFVEMQKKQNKILKMRTVAQSTEPK